MGDAPLPRPDQATCERLVAAARDIRERAYCPYSGFAVGAALLDDQGNIHCGVNVENASYPVGVCAERSALSVAVTAGARRFVAMALVTSAPIPVTPCGMCRQALAEFGSDLLLLLSAPTGGWNEQILKDALPYQFDPAHLAAGQEAEDR